MSVLSFGEWRPDVSNYRGQHSLNLNNVIPRGDGYGPWLASVAFTTALAATCRGYFYARKNDGSISIFAGTSTKLYNLNNTTGVWTDVSLGNGTYTTLGTAANWQFAQFNNFVFAVQQNCNPQVFDLTSSTNFADLAGSPPQAAYVAVVNRFLVLGGIASPNVYRVQWSGLNATTTWTSGVSQSDFQDLADGGIVRGISGGESGYIFQDQAIRRMTYAPGSPYVFGIDRVSSDDGLYAPYSLVTAGDRIFFCSPSGFKMLVPGGYPTPIGKEKVDRTFFADVDTANLQLVLGAHDPQQTRVYWAYKSINGTTGQFDKVLVYDWSLDRWALLAVSGEYMASLSKPSITLEQVDSAYGSNLDTLTITSLDAISNAIYVQFSMIDANNKLGFFNGPALEATLETPEQGADGESRIFINGVRPITDAASVYASLKVRDYEAQTASVTAESFINSTTGICNQRTETRFARGVIRIPAGTTWTFAAGVEPIVTTAGQR